MSLKSQDVYLVLKFVAAGSNRAPYALLAGELVMSPSEVHACVKRVQASHLLHDRRLRELPNVAAREE